MSRRAKPGPPAAAETPVPAVVAADLTETAVREYRRSRWRRGIKDFQPTVGVGRPHRGAKLE